MNEPLIRIWIDNGEFIDTTYDHKFIMRDGTECRADNLKVNDSLMPLYRRTAKLNKLEYEQVLHPATQKWQFTHKMVDNYKNGVPQKNEVVHHIDFNRLNNNPDNLVIMNKQEHLNYHGSLLNEIWDNNREERARNIRNGLIAWLDKGDNRKIKSEETAYYNKLYNRAKIIQEVLNTPEMRARQKADASKSRTEHFSNPANREHQSNIKSYLYNETALKMLGDIFTINNKPPRDKLLTILGNDKQFMGYLEKLNQKQGISNGQFKHLNKQVLWKMIKDLGYSDYTDFRSNYIDYKQSVNHKVAAIEYLEEKANCGCLTIEGNSNFGTQVSVFIGNSIQDNYFLPVSCLTLSTEILTLGGSKTLSRIIKEHQAGIINYVVTHNKLGCDCGSVVGSMVKWAGVTRKNTELVRVTLDNNEHVDVTPDHKFLLTNGSEVEAGKLEPGTTLQSHMGVIRVVEVIELAYKEDTGCLEVDNDNHNFLLTSGVFVRNSEGGRGSDITSIGGNPSGFAELGDIQYFQRKLYKALKYPMSRVSASEAKQEASIVFSNSPAGEISRDETKWATFLERYQARFCNEMKTLFLLHLEFKGLKKQYELDDSKINLHLNPPNFYKEKEKQIILESRFANYSALANFPEFAKSFLMDRYLDLSEEEIKANSDALKTDKKLGFKEDLGDSPGGGFPDTRNNSSGE